MRLLIAVIIVLSMVSAGWAGEAQDLKYTDSSGTYQIVPAHRMTISNPQGKSADIDFSGDKVTYTGNLPVDEAAKLFFDNVGGLCKQKQSFKLQQNLEDIEIRIDEFATKVKKQEGNLDKLQKEIQKEKAKWETKLRGGGIHPSDISGNAKLIQSDMTIIRLWDYTKEYCARRTLDSSFNCWVDQKILKGELKTKIVTKWTTTSITSPIHTRSNNLNLLMIYRDICNQTGQKYEITYAQIQWKGKQMEFELERKPIAHGPLYRSVTCEDSRWPMNSWFELK